jgi:hypothetical protein
MADGDDMVIGSWYNYATAPTFLSAKFSPVLWIDGSAKGAETGIYGQGSTIGIHGDAGDIGVKGESVKVGVRGTARTGAAEEILSAGNGVEGLSGSGIGVKGTSNSGAGVFGKGRPGVQGNGTSDGIGVVGIAGSNKGTGVEGQADGGTGVSGTVITGTGVFGRAPKGIALWGQSATKQGVLGQSSSSTGVEGTSVSGIGVKAEANGVFPAVVASAPNAIAVNGDGVYGVRGASTTKSGIGVFGKCSDGYAGYFEGNVLVNGDLTKTGIGSAVAVRFPDRSYRQLYSIESPESWFEDFGEGRLVKGKAEVKIDPDFAKTVDLRKRYHVFVTPHSAKISGLAVVARQPGRFRVEHPDGGSGTFSYRVVAKRADISVPRLKRMKMPDLDSIAKAERLITKGARGRARARRKRSGGRRGSKRRSV